MRHRAIILLVLVAFGSGCTSMGYVPRYVPPASMTQRTEPLRPSYTDVKELAYAQVSGYMISGRINRDALMGGSLIAGVSVAAMAALSFFAPTSMAMQLIPIGGGLAAGTAAVMQSGPKAVIYTRGGLLVLEAIGYSDERMVWGGSSLDTEALCLRRDLIAIDGRVTEHVLALQHPDQVVAQLRAIGASNVAGLQELANTVANYNNLKALTPACGRAALPVLPAPKR